MTCQIYEILYGVGMKSHLLLCWGRRLPIFKKKSSLEMKSLELFPRRFREDFFLKIGIQRAKVYTKSDPNIEVYDFIPGPSRPSHFKQVIVVLYLQGGYIIAAVCICYFRIFFTFCQFWLYLSRRIFFLKYQTDLKKISQNL